MHAGFSAGRVMTKFSILDLSSVTEGGSVRQSLHNSLDLAQHAEGWGYHRYWLAEHHNFPGIASAATSVTPSSPPLCEPPPQRTVRSRRSTQPP